MNDLINGLFELSGGILLTLNCFRLYHDKVVKGVNVWVTVFFAAWGYWNLYYYPSLNQWMSFTGTLLIVAANTVWAAMALYYARRKY